MVDKSIDIFENELGIFTISVTRGSVKFTSEVFSRVGFSQSLKRFRIFQQQFVSLFEFVKCDFKVFIRICCFQEPITKPLLKGFFSKNVCKVFEENIKLRHTRFYIIRS